MFTSTERSSSSSLSQETVLLTGEGSEASSSTMGRSFRQMCQSPALKTGMTIAAFVILSIVALAVVPGGMGIAGQVLGHTFMYQITQTVGFGMSITMTTVGALAGAGALSLLGYMLFCLSKSCGSTRREIEVINNEEFGKLEKQPEDDRRYEIEDVNNEEFKQLAQNLKKGPNGRFAIVKNENTFKVVWKDQSGFMQYFWAKSENETTWVINTEEAAIAWAQDNVPNTYIRYRRVVVIDM